MRKSELSTAFHNLRKGGLSTTELLSSTEVKKLYGFSRAKLKTFRDYQLLSGTKFGRGYSYQRTDVEQFLERTKGLDLSNKRKIALAASIIKTQDRKNKRSKENDMKVNHDPCRRTER